MGTSAQMLTRVVGHGGAVGACAGQDVQLHQPRALGRLWQLTDRARYCLHDNVSARSLQLGYL